MDGADRVPSRFHVEIRITRRVGRVVEVICDDRDVAVVVLMNPMSLLDDRSTGVILVQRQSSVLNCLEVVPDNDDE
jgi:hypothetical protein